jgi:hypothetical protein
LITNQTTKTSQAKTPSQPYSYYREYHSNFNAEQGGRSSGINNFIKTLPVNSEFEYLFNEKLKILEAELKRKISLNTSQQNEFKKNLIKKLRPQVESQLKQELEGEVVEKLRSEFEIENMKAYNNKKTLEMEKARRKMENTYKEKASKHTNNIKEKIYNELRAKYDEIFNDRTAELNSMFVGELKEHKSLMRKKLLEEYEVKNKQLYEEHEILKSELEELKAKEKEVIKQLNEEERELTIIAEKQRRNMLELEKVLGGSQPPQQQSHSLGKFNDFSYYSEKSAMNNSHFQQYPSSLKGKIAHTSQFSEIMNRNMGKVLMSSKSSSNIGKFDYNKAKSKSNNVSVLGNTKVQPSFENFHHPYL